MFIDQDRVDIDLMAERDGDTARIGEGDVYEGAYDTIRLQLADSWIVVDGQEYDLQIAGGVELGEGLSLQVAIQVDASTVSTVWLGWDLDENLDGDGVDWTLGTDVNVTVDVESPG